MKKLLILLLLVCLLPACAMAESPELTIEKSGENTHLTLTDGVYALTGGSNYVMSGSATETVKLSLSGSGTVMLVMDGAQIAVTTGAALHVERSEGSTAGLKLFLNSDKPSSLTSADWHALQAKAPLSITSSSPERPGRLIAQAAVGFSAIRVDDRHDLFLTNSFVAAAPRANATAASPSPAACSWKIPAWRSTPKAQVRLRAACTSSAI